MPPEIMEKIFSYSVRYGYAGPSKTFNWAFIKEKIDEGDRALIAEIKEVICRNLELLRGPYFSLNGFALQKFMEIFSEHSDMMKAVFDHFIKRPLYWEGYHSEREAYEAFQQACAQFSWSVSPQMTMFFERQYFIYPAPSSVMLLSERFAKFPDETVEFFKSRILRNSSSLGFILTDMLDLPREALSSSLFETLKQYYDTRKAFLLWRRDSEDAFKIKKLFAHIPGAMEWMFEKIEQDAVKLQKEASHPLPGLSSRLFFPGPAAPGASYMAGAGAGIPAVVVTPAFTSSTDILLKTASDVNHFYALFEGCDVAMLRLFNLLLGEQKQYLLILESSPLLLNDWWKKANWVLSLFPLRTAEVKAILFEDFRKNCTAPWHPFAEGHVQSSLNLLSFKTLFDDVPLAMEWLFTTIKADLGQYGPDLCIPPRRTIFDMFELTRVFHALFDTPEESLVPEAMEWLKQRLSVDGRPKVDPGMDPLINNPAIDLIFELWSEVGACQLDTHKKDARISPTPVVVLTWILVFLGLTTEQQQKALIELQKVHAQLKPGVVFNKESVVDGIKRIAQKLSSQVLKEHGLTLSIQFSTDEQVAAYMENIRRHDDAVDSFLCSDSMVSMLHDGIVSAGCEIISKVSTRLDFFAPFQFKPCVLKLTSLSENPLPDAFLMDPERIFVRAKLGENRLTPSGREFTLVKQEVKRGLFVVSIFNEFEQKVMEISAPEHSVVQCVSKESQVLLPAFNMKGDLEQLNSSSKVYEALFTENSLFGNTTDIRQVNTTASLDVSHVGVKTSSSQTVGVAKGIFTPINRTIIFCEHVNIQTFNPRTGESIMSAFYESFDELDPTEMHVDRPEKLFLQECSDSKRAGRVRTCSIV